MSPLVCFRGLGYNVIWFFMPAVSRRLFYDRIIRLKGRYSLYLFRFLKGKYMDQNNNSGDSYEFISETIKKRPINKKRAFLKFLFTVFLAVVFGIVACFTYVLLLPRVQEFIYANEVNFIKLMDTSDPDEQEQEVKLAESEDHEETVNEAENSIETEPSVKEKEEKKGEAEEESSGNIENSSVKEPAEPAENTTEQAKTDTFEREPEDIKEDISLSQETETEPEEKAPSDPMLTVTGESVQAGAPLEKQFEINDYTLLYQKIGSVADEARKCIVTVTAIYSDSDWFQNIYESKHQTTGVILADNGKELLIIAKTRVIEDADDIQVTFYDGLKLSGTLKKSDKNTDLSAVAVELSQIDEEDRHNYTMAELGNSRSRSIKGKPVIALGDPLGVNDSMAIGQITSGSVVVDKTDSNVSLLTTDIYGSTNASGVLCDFDGKVLGIICHDGNTQDVKNLIRAYSITDIKSTIEKILNGQDIAYLGIEGTDVTDEISDTYGIPKGAYVTQVVVDSPAMKAGIQNGDVIVKLGTKDINSFTDYKEAMLKSQPKDATTVTIKRLGREEYVDISYEVVLGKL